MNETNPQTALSSGGSRKALLGFRISFGLALVPAAVMLLCSMGEDAAWKTTMSDYFTHLACVTVVLSTVASLFYVMYKFGPTSEKSPEKGGL